MRIRWVEFELRGFRSFGSSAHRIDLQDGLTVVHAANSQGKSVLAEALEFLLTGDTSRRELFGGAKNEYDQCLRNVHLASSDPVWVCAELELDNGSIVEIRRDLDSDSHLTRNVAAPSPSGAVKETPRPYEAWRGADPVVRTDT